MVDEQRVGAERERDDGESEAVDDRDLDLVGREVERADDRDRRAFPEQRATARRPCQRRDQDDAERAEERTADIDPAALHRRAEADQEEDDGHDGERRDAVDQEGGDRRGGEESGCRAGAHGLENLCAKSPASRLVDRPREREALRRPTGPLPGERSTAVRCGVPVDELEEVGGRRNGSTVRSDVIGAERVGDPLRVPREARVRNAPRPARVVPSNPCRNGSGKRAGDDLERGCIARPVAVVPPRDIAVAQRGRR